MQQLWFYRLHSAYSYLLQYHPATGDSRVNMSFFCPFADKGTKPLCLRTDKGLYRKTVCPWTVSHLGKAHKPPFPSADTDTAAGSVKLKKSPCPMSDSGHLNLPPACCRASLPGFLFLHIAGTIYYVFCSCILLGCKMQSFSSCRGLSERIEAL